MAEVAAYTCISCRVAFVDTELQRCHYKSDWHRYNLKRKVAELPPVTAENFQERVLSQRAQQAESEKETSGHCKLCNKNFSSQNAYTNHVQSKKHRDAEVKKLQHLSDEVAKINEKNKAKRIDVLPENEKRLLKDAKNWAIKEDLESSRPSSSDVKVKTSTSDNKISSNVDKEDMDSDDESVESWDGDALGLEECLFCSHLSKSMEKNIHHMTVAHSFFIPDLEFVVDLEELLTYLGEKVGEGHMCLWCNTRSKAYLTTKAAQQHMVDKGHCNMLFEGDALFEYSDYYDYRKSYPDYVPGTEDVEGMDVDEEEVHPEILNEDENFQLVLPSGATVGHRSLQRYYRQNLRSEREGKPNAVTRVMAQYRALGWTGTTGLSAQKRAKDIAFVQRMKKRHSQTLALKTNKMQHHFRDDNFGIRH